MARRITVSLTLPETLWREARAAAIRRGTGVSRVVEILLHEWLTHEPPATTGTIAESEPIIAYLLEQPYHAAPIPHIVRLVAKRTGLDESTVRSRLSALCEQGLVEQWLAHDGNPIRWMGLEEMVRLSPSHFPQNTGR